MNRIRSKQNLNPNSFALVKKDDVGVKTRYQSRPLFKQNPNNPEKAPDVLEVKKKKHQKKVITKKNVEGEMCYQDQIIVHIFQRSKQNLKKFKNSRQNKQYKIFRPSLLESVYKECQHFQLKHKTFFLYVHYLDSFMISEEGRKLSQQDLIRANYACFLMAQKYQQIYPPSICEWLPQNIHQAVYKWQGKIIYALDFKLIHESLRYYFQYWSSKYQLVPSQFQNCNIVLYSIVFNYDLMYKYQPQKIAKAVVLMENQQTAKKFTKLDIIDPFNSPHQQEKIKQDLKKHILSHRGRISWIKDLN